MAKRVQEILVDDLDGSEAKETVQFGLDSRFYQIDLSEKNYKETRETLKKYIRKADTLHRPRRTKRSRSASGPSRTTTLWPSAAACIVTS